MVKEPIPSIVTPPWTKVARTKPAPTFVSVSKPVGLIVARFAGLVLQLNVFVRSSIVPSENIPVAVSCSLKPLAKEGFAGVIRSEVSIAAVTVTVVEPWTPPRVAVIGVFPTFTPVTSPLVPAALLTEYWPLSDWKGQGSGWWNES
jgi:hypothetical protein